MSVKVYRARPGETQREAAISALAEGAFEFVHIGRVYRVWAKFQDTGRREPEADHHDEEVER